MRFKLIMIPGGYEDAKPGAMPDAAARQILELADFPADVQTGFP